MLLKHYPCSFLFRPDVFDQLPIKCFTPDRHLQLIEWILHHIICIQLIDPPSNHIHVRLLRLREQQKLEAGKRLEAGQAEGG